MDNQTKASRDRSVLFEPGNARRCERCGKWGANRRYRDNLPDIGKALIEIFGAETQQTFDACMTSENDARAQIVKNWSSFAAGARQRCVNTTGYMPSYVEWLTCLEMEQQVNEMRKKAATNSATTEGRGARTVVRPDTPANSRGPRIGSAAKPCPVVQFGSDGSIISLIAC
jgi:hypothetical protein